MTTDRSPDNLTAETETAGAATAEAPAAPAASCANPGNGPDPAPEPDATPAAKKFSWLLKAFGVLLILSGALTVLGMVALAVLGVLSGLDGASAKVTTIVFMAVELVFRVAMGVLYFRLGLRLLRDRRLHAAGIARTIMTMLVLTVVVDLMVSGISPSMIATLVQIAIMVALQSYLDPSLAEERELNRKLRKLEERSDEEERVARLRRSQGKAPYQLNFFNIFWTFVVCSVLGLVIEDIYHAVVFGGYEDRAGLLFGPFSPIYGFGAVLMTLALNRIRNKNVLLIFVCSAVIGGAFEYFVSWFMQFSFGITAWDYSGTFLSIGGRTNGFFMACWGVLGVAWVKWLLPNIFKLIYLIPWNWRYVVTTAAAVLMVVDGVMTLQALDCWYLRASGHAPETSLQQFYAEHFDDAYMANRFQTMTMDIESSARIGTSSSTASAAA